MNIRNQKDEQRKRIHKAANTASEYQAAWKDFYAKPSHMIAREVITKGEATLDQQNTTGRTMLNANSVRHRILTAQDWLEKTPEPAAPQKATEKLFKHSPTIYVRILINKPKLLILCLIMTNCHLCNLAAQ